ncbi:hypothetical protein [Nesterenkonia lutea]|uniref:Uncharacterized protein n=1 Tax=Nesterenkonia lutea TaxID=272919 RepID=A0ABR9JFB0_9MICC|nr:hypothetical protein [Nesterenkonia lutea]MBE1524615.1 hypothetical protein [Nesterenkonia lutea]
MEPNRYVLKGTSLAKLGAQALAEYGPRARIVSAERVTRGGIGGFLAREHFEATVEVPAPRPEQSPPPPAPEVDSRRRRRLRAQEKSQPWDETEARTEGGESESPVEDLDEDFARMMDELWLASREPAGERELGAAPGASLGSPLGTSAGASTGTSAVAPTGTTAAPALLQAPGTLMVLACLGAEESAALAALVASAADGALGDPLLLAEADYASKPLREARAVLREARAKAVGMEVPVLATCALRFPRPGVLSGAESPAVKEADQLWAAVDLRRKPEDIRHWLAVLEQSRPIDGLVLTCADETLTPATGHQLGWPVSVRMNQC